MRKKELVEAFDRLSLELSFEKIQSAEWRSDYRKWREYYRNEKTVSDERGKIITDLLYLLGADWDDISALRAKAGAKRYNVEHERKMRLAEELVNE